MPHAVLFPAGDLTAVYAGRDLQGNLLVCAQVRENTIPEIAYFLRIKSTHRWRHRDIPSPDRDSKNRVVSNPPLRSLFMYLPSHLRTLEIHGLFT